jgi:transcriptional regulator with PAS, ATPase and Fis domain
VGLNCAALTETLLESELFGHERGAFSGAVSTKPGLFEVAEKGTVFLDEIAEMSLSIQAKLLRVLEERQVLRVGGLAPRPINVRFLAASHRDLEAEVTVGRFRQDLYFRLNGITLTIPPLRERTNEIDGLVTSFAADACKRSKRATIPRLTKEATMLLKQYAWPGNIRELRNVVERAVLLCNDDLITPEHLPAEKMKAMTSRAWRAPTPDFRQTAQLHTPVPPPQPVYPQPLVAATRAAPRAPGPDAEPITGPPRPAAHMEDTRTPSPAPLKGAVQDFEKDRILDALQRVGGNQTKAAELLGISRRTLLNRLDSYNLPRPRKGS